MTNTDKRIDYILADPEGNRTILVLTPVEREDYQKTAQLLLQECPEAEQVGYIKSPVVQGDVEYPYMEMCGLEFCGNATRAFAYYHAVTQDPPLEEIMVKVSGAEEPLTAWIDRDNGSAKIQMPVPIGMKRLTVPLDQVLNGGKAGAEKSEATEKAGAEQSGATEEAGVGQSEVTGNLVEMEGIAHLVLMDVEPKAETFEALKKYVYENVEDFPAFGVMFIDVASGLMTPVVYVRDVDTTYFEGSCASGTIAAAYSMTATCCVPVRTHTFIEPAGTLSVEVHIESGKITKMLLEGGVGLSETKTFVVR